MSQAFAPGKVAYIINERSDVAPVLISLRHRAGWTCEETDARAGWADRYLTKMENPDTPSGRWGYRIEANDVQVSAMGALWSQVFGCVLVMVDLETAKAIGAVPAPERLPGRRAHNAGQGDALLAQDKAA